MAPETLERIGRRFYRAAEVTATGSGLELGLGLGLGLSIVKRIAELHGGSVSFRHGDAARGLRVEVTIPIQGCERSG